MSRTLKQKADYSKKIVKMLADKPAVSFATLTEELTSKSDSRAVYALTRSIRNLTEGGFITRHESGRDSYARLTNEGRKKANSLKLESDTSLLNPHWDGKWRIILIDFPEDRKTERDSFRYLLKKAGFVCIKNAVWISSQPFEHLFANIKKDLSLTTEIMIFVTDTLDPETEQEFLSIVK